MGSTGTIVPGNNRTQVALATWAASLPASCYLVAAIPAEGVRGPLHRRLLTAEGLGGALPWLRHLNSNGWHIVGRPWAPRHVLVDDLDAGALARLQDQHQPAAVVQSSHGSFQAWLTIDHGLVAPDLAGAVARLLARRFGGDPGAANAVQCGRVPGFTNRKARHCVDGRYPFALLEEAEGPLVDPGAADLLLAAARTLPARGPDPCLPAAATQPGLQPRKPAEEYEAAAGRVRAFLGSGVVVDRSRLDFAIARRLLLRGMALAEVVEVVKAGPRAASLSGGAAGAYARRTVEAAVRSTGRR